LNDNLEEGTKNYYFEKNYLAPYFGEEKNTANLVELRVRAAKEAMAEIFSSRLTKPELRRVWGEFTPGHYVYDTMEVRIEQDVELLEIVKKKEGFFDVGRSGKNYHARVNTKVTNKIRSPVAVSKENQYK